eukprot:g4280.t1
MQLWGRASAKVATPIEGVRINADRNDVHDLGHALDTGLPIYSLSWISHRLTIGGLADNRASISGSSLAAVIDCLAHRLRVQCASAARKWMRTPQMQSASAVSKCSAQVQCASAARKCGPQVQSASTVRACSLQAQSAGAVCRRSLQVQCAGAVRECSAGAFCAQVLATRKGRAQA